MFTDPESYFRQFFDDDLPSAQGSDLGTEENPYEVWKGASYVYASQPLVYDDSFFPREEVRKLVDAFKASGLIDCSNVLDDLADMLAEFDATVGDRRTRSQSDAETDGTKE